MVAVRKDPKVVWGGRTGQYRECQTCLLVENNYSRDMATKHPKSKKAGVFQYFYHCSGEGLPIRDVCNRQKRNHTTEPHYENLTENWCKQCNKRRIKSANREEINHLFLMTRYWKDNHPMNGKLLVVGFLYRAKENVWLKLSRSIIPSGAKGFDPKTPDRCEFFAGDEKKSHFVSADKAFVLDSVKNSRRKYFATAKEVNKIVAHLKKSKNILGRLRAKVNELKTKSNKDRNEKHCKNRC